MAINYLTLERHRIFMIKFAKLGISNKFPFGNDQAIEVSYWLLSPSLHLLD